MNTLRSLVRDRKGTAAIVFGLSLPVMLAAIGAAVDYSHAMAKRSSMQNAVDAAALAAGKLVGEPDEKRKAVGQAIFSANYDDHSKAQFDLQVLESGSTVKIVAEQTLPTFIMKLVGINEVVLKTEAEVPAALSGFAEIALVMDYSDSMIDGGKYVRMYEAGAKMIDLVTNYGNNTNVRIALVPFSAVVRADIAAEHIRSDLSFDGCTMDRRFPFNTQEGTSNAATDAAKWGDYSIGGHDCGLVAAANLKVLPLSSDFADVKAKLAAFKPHLWTHIAAGAEFGWQVISPEGVFGGARAYSDKKNVKAVILLTDGMQTTPGWGPGNERTAAHGEANLLSICNGMKAKGVEVYTIGYDLSDTHTLSLLENCAGEGKYFASSDIDKGLMTILSEISERIQERMVRLAR